MVEQTPAQLSRTEEIKTVKYVKETSLNWLKKVVQLFRGAPKPAPAVVPA